MTNAMVSDSSLPRLDVSELAERCREESRKFFRDQLHDDRYCFELFRRALTHGNDYAWDILYDSYGNLVRGWVRRCSGIDSLDMPLDELVALSFQKFWGALAGSDKVERFDSLRALLQYLRTCCASTVTDALRRQRTERYLTELDHTLAQGPERHPDRQLMDDEGRAHFWAMIQALLNDELEVLLVHSYFVMGLKPRQIQRHYPQHFPDVQDVYRIKRNVMNRLRRAQELQEVWPA